jgi:hypothetical protein
LVLDPETARECHDETLAAEGAKTARFSSLCRSHFYSKSREDVRKFAAAKDQRRSLPLDRPEKKATDFQKLVPKFT